MKWLIGICAVMAMMFATPINAQTVLTFDDVGVSTGQPIPDGYGGLNWDNMRVLDATQSIYIGTGYNNGLVSGDWVAYNEFAEIGTIDNGQFIFYGVYLTAAWNNDLQIDVEGYLNGALVGSTTVEVDTDAPTLFEFFWVVDTLVFESYGGTDADPYDNGSGAHFAMDDFMFIKAFEVEKTLDVVDDEDGDGEIEVGEPVTFTMTVTVTNVSGETIEDVKIIDGIGGDLKLVSVDGVPIDDPPGTKKKKDNEATYGTDDYISVSWSGNTQKAHLTCSMGDLDDGESASITIVVETDVNPGQTPKDDPVHEFTSAEEDHELNTAEVCGMIDDLKVYGISNTILIDIVEPVE